MPKTNPREPLHAELLSELLALARSRDALPCDCLRSVQAHTVRKYDVEGATLSFPLLGNFRYREKSRWLQVRPGEVMVVPNARSIDIEYIPDAQACEFVALSVVLTEHQLEAARLLLSAPPPTGIGTIAAISIGELLDPLVRWTKAMRNGRRAMSLHAMVEVALCLYESGHTALLRPQPPSLAMTIRRLVASDPARNWKSAEIEDITGLSGPTLRRRMADESITL